MPQIGLGTFLSKEPKELEEVVVAAIMEKGYRHFDCAWIYQNEDVVGRALKQCFDQGVKREDLFITTKCIPQMFHRIEDSLKESLQKLQLDYVDLFLVHATIPCMDYEKNEVKGPALHEVWATFESLKEKGLTKSIGISNATVSVYVNLLASAKVKPAVN